MKPISSRTNPLIKHIATLQHKKYRDRHGQFCAEGMRTCTTLIKRGFTPENVFVTEPMIPEVQKLIADESITIIPAFVMEKISLLTTPSGILCQFQIPPTPNVSTLSSGIVLAQIADPGNMGTLIRTAAALNQKSIVIIEGADPWSPKVVQASAGTIGMIHIFQWSWQELVNQRQNIKLIALEAAGGKNPSQLSFANSLLVVGSEAHGIPHQWIAQCDEVLTLPMPGDAQSLNAAVAGSIALYLASQSS